MKKNISKDNDNWYMFGNGNVYFLAGYESSC